MNSNRLSLMATVLAIGGFGMGFGPPGGTRPRRAYTGDKSRVGPQSNRSKKLTAKMDAKRAREAARKAKP